MGGRRAHTEKREGGIEGTHHLPQQHQQRTRLPTQDRQVTKVIKILQRMAMLSYKKKSAMPKNLKVVLWGI